MSAATAPLTLGVIFVMLLGLVAPGCASRTGAVSASELRSDEVKALTGEWRPTYESFERWHRHTFVESFIAARKWVHTNRHRRDAETSERLALWDGLRIPVAAGVNKETERPRLTLEPDGRFTASHGPSAINGTWSIDRGGRLVLTGEEADGTALFRIEGEKLIGEGGDLSIPMSGTFASYEYTRLDAPAEL